MEIKKGDMDDFDFHPPSDELKVQIYDTPDKEDDEAEESEKDILEWMKKEERANAAASAQR